MREDDFLQSFENLETDLLDAHAEGQSSLQAFVHRLSKLHSASRKAISENTISNNTISFLHSVALSGSTIVENLIRLSRTVDEVYSRRQPEISEIFSRLTLEDTPPSDELEKPTQRHTRKGRTEKVFDGDHDKTLVQRPILYQWLVDHIHHPYPSSKCKAVLAKETNTSIRTINDWFVNARRRIGWSTIAQRHFDGDRWRTVDCATRFFLKRDGYSAINASITQNFLEMQTKAESLCHSNSIHTAEMLLNPSVDELTSDGSQHEHANVSRTSRKRSRALEGDNERHSLFLPSSRISSVVNATPVPVAISDNAEESVTCSAEVVLAPIACKSLCSSHPLSTTRDGDPPHPRKKMRFSESETSTPTDPSGILKSKPTDVVLTSPTRKRTRLDDNATGAPAAKRLRDSTVSDTTVPSPPPLENMDGGIPTVNSLYDLSASLFIPEAIPCVTTVDPFVGDQSQSLSFDWATWTPPTNTSIYTTDPFDPPLLGPFSADPTLSSLFSLPWTDEGLSFDPLLLPLLSGPDISQAC